MSALAEPASGAEPAPYARIAVLAQLGRAGGLFTYRLPDDLLGMAPPGTLVRVPFAQRQLQGIVVELDHACDLPRVRDVLEVLDPRPVVTSHQLRLAHWIAEYYHAPISDVLGAMLPPGLGRDTVAYLLPGEDTAGSRLTPEQQRILEAVRGHGEKQPPPTTMNHPVGTSCAGPRGLPLGEADLRRRSLPDVLAGTDVSTVGTAGSMPGYQGDACRRILEEEVRRLVPGEEGAKAIASLLRRGLLRREYELAGPRVAPRRVRVVAATAEGRAALVAGVLDRAPRQREVLVALDEPAELPVLRERFPGVTPAVKALAGKGYVRVEEREVARSPLARRSIPPTNPLNLSPAQRMARDTIVRSAGRSQVFLLHGVTGSGKTEVYLQAIAATIRRGKQAILMVPEISLTPQAVERVAGRFPGRVAVLHSKLSPGERLDEWQRVRRGEVDVVVGPRSALLAPVPSPGLIVVDEEHDPSYKQDASPRYHGRDAAAILGRMTGATVVFGSATPDIVTYAAAREGRVGLLELAGRPVWGSAGESRPMPPVEVVDMRHELKAGNRSIFSTPLLAALEETLVAEHQALLFLNRRGTATVVLCRDCGYVVRCPQCDIPFTYHATSSVLICHRCDRRSPSPRVCPDCRGPRIRYLGAGTQRVEAEVRQALPGARVLRWDRDVTGAKDAAERIVDAFAAHEADILVGTQMIAKGLDFPLVTLVGVVSADTGLHLPDFRAPERSFQLLTQVAGRAGRASLPSRVIVQTYTPEHYAIQAARTHDYHRFYREEMLFRRNAGYPPFTRLVRLVYADEREEACRLSAENLHAIFTRAIAQEGLAGVEIIGPAPCFAARSKGRYFWQLIVRGPVRRGERGLHTLLDYVPPGWTVDVDPVDLL